MKTNILALIAVLLIAACESPPDVVYQEFRQAMQREGCTDMRRIVYFDYYRSQTPQSDVVCVVWEEKLDIVTGKFTQTDSLDN